ncbi:MAG: zinc ribbon domain-containing protein [Candidatus Bathyarchaeia archaeon]
MPFCPFCGTPVKENHKFCPSCGNPLELVPQIPTPTPQATPTPQPQQPQQPASAPQPAAAPQPPQVQTTQGETIREIIPNLSVSKSFGRTDTYNLIVTERRSIFAKLTTEIINETVKMRRDKAAAEGKGFFGKWKAQMQGFNTYTDWYKDKTPDQALGETPGNYAIDNSAMRNIKVKEDSDDDSGMDLYYIEITTPTGKLKFKTPYDPRKLLQAAYGGA